MQINEYEDNKEVIENLEKLIAEQKSITRNITVKERQIESCEERVLESIKFVGTYEQKVENLREQKQEYQDFKRSLLPMICLCSVMHPNGIAYDIIKKKDTSH